MALKVDTHARWCENLEVKELIPASRDTTWQPAYGESSHIRDHYNALIVRLVKMIIPFIRWK